MASARINRRVPTLTDRSRAGVPSFPGALSLLIVDRDNPVSATVSLIV